MDPQQTQRWAAGVVRSLKGRLESTLGLAIGDPLPGACGGHGCVFDTDRKALLLKITDHAEEASAAFHIKSLQAGGWLRDVVRIKSVHRLPRGAWAIVRERVKLSDLSVQAQAILWDVNEELYQLHLQHAAARLDPMVVPSWRLLEGSRELLPVQRLRLELLHLGLTDLDLLAGNLGVRAFTMKGWPRKGTLVLLDTGGVTDLQGRPLPTSRIPELARNSAAANRAMVPARFGLDDSPTWRGWTDGRLWNGFAMPWFDRDTAIAILSWLERDGVKWKVVGDDLFYRFPQDDPGEWEVCRPERHGYPLGSASWTWWNLDDEEGVANRRSGRANCPGQRKLETAFARIHGSDKSGGHCEIVSPRELSKITRDHGWRSGGNIVGFHTPDDRIFVRSDATWSVAHEIGHRWLDDDHIARWVCEGLNEFASQAAAEEAGEPHQATYGHERSLIEEYIVPATGAQPLQIARMLSGSERPDELLADMMQSHPHWRRVGRRRTLRAISSGSGDEPRLFLNLAPRTNP